MKNERQEHAVEKRRLMYSQIFSPNTTYRDGSRTIDVSAAVEGGARTTETKINLTASVIAILVVVVLCILFSLFGSRIVYQISGMIASRKNKIEIQLEEPDSIAFDTTKILESGGRVYIGGDTDPFLKEGTYLTLHVSDWSEMPLIGSEKNMQFVTEDLSFGELYYSVFIEGADYGFLRMYINDAKAEKKDEKSYQLLGKFKIADYTAKNETLTEIKTQKATFVYELENGQKAYFVRNWLYGNYTVCFVAGDIYYEMEIPASDRAVTRAEQIFESLSAYLD